MIDMEQAVKSVGREHAAVINPLIGSMTGDTIDNVNQMIGFIKEYALADKSAFEPDHECLYVCLNVISRALDYESELHCMEANT